jgi:hypothetical protein
MQEKTYVLIGDTQGVEDNKRFEDKNMEIAIHSLYKEMKKQMRINWMYHQRT